tara:strand:- start:10590 stop:11135 length:546 start_codon:yes stop_codon:yes gene_type:complete
MGKKSKKRKKDKKLNSKSILKKLNRVIEWMDDNMYNKGCEVVCEDLDETIDYDEEIEKEIIDYLDLSLEYSGNISNIKIDYGNGYVNINGYKQNNAKGHIVYEEHFSISFDTNRKSLEVCGSIFDDGRIRMKYKKLGKYTDKIINLKKKIDRNNFMQNYLKLYDVSELSREKSLKDLNLED